MIFTHWRRYVPYGGAGVDKKYTYTLGRHVYAPSVGTFCLKSFSCMKNCQVKGKQANEMQRNARNKFLGLLKIPGKFKC